MSMTREHYEMLARHVIAVRHLSVNTGTPQQDSHTQRVLDSFARSIAVDLIIDNPNFDVDRFLPAAGVVLVETTDD